MSRFSYVRCLVLPSCPNLSYFIVVCLVFVTVCLTLYFFLSHFVRVVYRSGFIFASFCLVLSCFVYFFLTFFSFSISLSSVLIVCFLNSLASPCLVFMSPSCLALSRSASFSCLTSPLCSVSACSVLFKKCMVVRFLFLVKKNGASGTP